MLHFLAFCLFISSASIFTFAQNSQAHADMRASAPTASSGIDEVKLANRSLALDVPIWNFRQRGGLDLRVWIAYESPTFASTFECNDSASITTVASQEKQAMASYTDWAWPEDASGHSSSVANPQSKGPAGSCSHYPDCPPVGTPNVFCEFHWDLAEFAPTSFIPWVDGDAGQGLYGMHIASSTDVSVSLVPQGNFPDVFFFYWKVNTPGGGSHRLAKVSKQAYYVAADSGWKYTPATCELRDGNGTFYSLACNQIPGGQSYPFGSKLPGRLNYVEDLDGNRITLNFDGNSNFTGWTDTIGRTIASPALSSPTTVNVPCPSSSDVSSTWQIPGITPAVEFCSTSIAINTKLLNMANQNNRSASEANAPYFAFSQIVLPNGDRWQFVYGSQSDDTQYQSGETYGDLAKVVLPTGGTIRYHWTPAEATCISSPGSAPARAKLFQRDVSNGTGATATWRYAFDNAPLFAAWDPYGNKTVHAFATPNDVCSLVDSQVDYEDNAQHVLKTERFQYVPWPTSAYSTLDFSNTDPLISAHFITRTENGGSASTGETVSYGVSFAAEGMDDDHTVSNLPYALESGRASYDFFQSSAPNSASLSSLPVQKQESTLFRLSSDADASAWNDIHSIVMHSVASASAQSRSTTYGYTVANLPSGNASSQAGSATIWNSAPPSGAYRNHPTSVTSAGQGGVGGSLSSQTTQVYTNTGTLYSITLPHDAFTPDTVTMVTSSSSYQGAVPTGWSDVLSHASSVSYEQTTLLPDLVTDQNSQPTQYTYYGDSRLHEVLYPDGSKHTYSYPSPNEVDEVVTLSSTASVTTKTFYDGLGRKISTVTPSACSDGSDLSVETSYDLMDRVRSVTNPHCGSGAFGTTYYGSSDLSKNDGYDALGRSILLTNPDGTTRTWTYNDRSVDPLQDSVTLTDENGHTTSQITDALGHLVGVVEAGGLRTSYTVNAFGELTDVSQTGAAGEQARLRHFDYDSLGRLTASQNPETGSLTYGYDTHGNVITKTDARGKTTAFEYDALNRIIHRKNVSGTGVAARSSCYFYDGLPGSTGSNSVGRLSAEWTQQGECPSSISAVPVPGATTWRSITSYDAMGRVFHEEQCAHAPCSVASKFTFDYTYDYAGNRTGSTNGISTAAPSALPLINLGYGMDAFGRLNQITAAESPTNWLVLDATHPQTLLGNTTYGPFGLLHAEYGIRSNDPSAMLTSDFLYDIRGRRSDLAASVTVKSSLSSTIISGTVAGAFPVADILVSCASACGQVRVQIGGATSQTVTLDSAGHATVPIGTTLAAGSYILTASYLGDGYHPPATTYIPFTVANSTAPATSIVAALSSNPVSTTGSATPLVVLGCSNACGTVSVALSTGVVLQQVTVASDGSVPTTAIQAAQLAGTLLTVSYSGDATHAPTSTTIPFKLSSTVPVFNVTMWAPDSKPALNATINVSGVFPNNQTPSDGFIFSNDGVPWASGAFYGNGLGHYYYVGPRALGRHIMTATHNQSSSIEKASASCIFEFIPDASLPYVPANLTLSSTTITQSAPLPTIYTNASVNYYGAYSYYLDGQMIFNGALTQGFISPKPIASVHANNLSLGTHVVSLEYGGSGVYRPTHLEVSFTVVSQ